MILVLPLMTTGLRKVESFAYGSIISESGLSSLKSWSPLPAPRCTILCLANPDLLFTLWG